ncbi:MAG: hypothetical protein LBC80_04075 [Treponema sp.]|jgi:hypothetical protein|nr:hypothetical protein [Treponema sp.]
MNKIIRTMAFFLFLLLTTAVFAEVEFNIRFFDRRIYYATDESIYIQITITNNTPSPYRFRLADDRAFSMDIDARTMTNRTLPQADSLIQKRTTNMQVFFREVTIDSRESFSFTENLKDFVRFDGHGSFRIQALIYPELIQNVSVTSSRASITSNTLTLSIRPPAITGSDGIPLEMDVTTGAVLVKQPLSPDEVVAYMLTARQQSQWERFFLYLDLEAMFLRDAYQRRRYTTENEAGRLRLLADYRLNMQNATVDGMISLIPTTFEILRTEYTHNEGTVTVMQRFRHINHTELRLYRYTLEKRDNIWMIVNYTVQGMGTEAND